MGIFEHLTIQFWGILTPTLIFVGTIIFKFGRQDARLIDIEEDFAELKSIIKSYHGKCEVVTSRMGKTVTYEGLRMHCKESQENCFNGVCRKIKAVENKVDEAKEASKDLSTKVDHNQEITTLALTKIAGSLGRLEGRFCGKEE